MFTLDNRKGDLQVHELETSGNRMLNLPDRPMPPESQVALSGSLKPRDGLSTKCTGLKSLNCKHCKVYN